MRIFTVLALVLPALVVGRFPRWFAKDDASFSSSILGASPASTPTLGSTVATSVAGQDALKLRQAPGLAPINPAPVTPTVSTTSVANLANPNVPPVQPTIPIVDMPVVPRPGVTTTSVRKPPNPVVPPVVAPPPANPVAPVVPGAVPTAVSTRPTLTTTRPRVSGDFVTTQWVETWIDSTSRTWVPKTITLRFKPMSVAAPPGSGEIGMGTLTGETGKTKTIYVGAAPSQAPGWVHGFAAVVGVGVVGMAV